MNKDDQQNKQDFEKLIVQTASLGKKLGLLLNALNISEEYKKALVEILPEFSYEQLVELVVVLEDLYANQETNNLDQEFLRELQKIQEEYKEEKNKAVQKLNQNLSDLEKDLDNLSK